MQLNQAQHPLLDPACFITELPSSLSELETPSDILGFFAPGASGPLTPADDIRTAVRDLLRHGGFKPTGRSKPASEYLIKAVEKGWFTSDKGINLAVDACNVVSLHSGLPISVIDLDRTEGNLELKPCDPETHYVFNPAGQTIDVSKLISLHDQKGPCAGPVKDSQRTKTHDGTCRTLSIIWGTNGLPGRTQAALDWYTELLNNAGTKVSQVTITKS